MFGAVAVGDSFPAKLDAALLDLTLPRQLAPMLTDWGVQDSDVLIHSLGVTLWTLLGDRLGYASVAEIPASSKGGFALLGDKVRSDCGWFDRQSKENEVLIEFERFTNLTSDEAKLRLKVQNLLLAHQRFNDAPRHLVLAYWTKALVNVPEHKKFSSLIRQGFTLPITNEQIPGTVRASFHCFQFYLQCDRNGLLKLSEIIRRF